MEQKAPNDMDLGSTSEKLSQTLKSSKMTSGLFDPPLRQPVLREARKPLAKYWLVRLYLSMSIVITALVIYLMPHSSYGVVLSSTRSGWVIMSILVGFGVVGMLDVLCNDFSDRRRIPLTREHRHWIYNGQALAILALTYTLVRAAGWSPILLVFADKCAAALIVAPLDLFARHREEI